ncbi:extracellular solute-binding protein [Cohnella fermenti]|uniref:Extracellular solute-binding protein n=1 Tax=Cohnella fermenti TaxID=2565925 RepID=A0A4S4BLP8_9BACL|nr:extracellular solute-binding protein [Cohnella fermenti]THF75709.1 extracellular solute-binding protein [Cohnella fermenti]
MSKNWTNVGIIASVFALTAGLLAGCGKESDQESSSGSPAASSAATASAGGTGASKPYDVTVALWDVATNLTDPATDKLLKTVEEKTNLSFEAQAVTWNDYKEKFNLWAASGQLPDMFVTDFRLTPTVDTWIKQGLLHALPDDLSAYPNLQKIMEMPDVKPLAIDGKFYFIPRLTKLSSDEYATERGYVVRKDWMEKLGIETPKTFEEYEAMFAAFAKNDPDGNGKADTIGLTHNFSDVFGTLLALGSSVPNIKGWMQEDGKWIPSIASTGMTDYLTKFKKLYDDGALDPDFALLKTNDGMDKFSQGNVGALAVQISDNFLYTIKQKWDKANPNQSFEDSITILPGWTAPDGNQYRFYQSTAYSDIYFSSKLSDDEFDALLKFIDFNLSEEGQDLYSYGFEGEDYTKENGTIVPSENRVNYPSYKFFIYLDGVGHSRNVPREVRASLYGENLVNLSYDMYDRLIAEAKPIPINFNVDLINSTEKNSFQSVINGYMDDITKIVLGSEDVETAWAKQLKVYEGKGMSKAIEEVNAIVAEKGIQ